ncbi:MAG: RidA family protein [Candidatus Izemoplasmatales bacterium]
MKKIIESTKAPKAIGPYSQAIQVGDTLYLSGQLPIDPQSGSIKDTIEEQTMQCLINILEIVKDAGFSKEDIVKVQVFMKDLSLFTKMNEVYAHFFESHKPARVTVEVARLPKDVFIEIDAIVAK